MKLLLAATIGAGLIATASGAAAAALPRTRTFVVTGTGTAHITWWDGSRLKGIEYPVDLREPWQLELPAGYEVRAQLNGEGEIVCVGKTRQAKSGRFPYVTC